MALLRNVATVGGYTMISRVFGFVRDAVTAAALGAGPISDAFVVAQRLPNLFRQLFAEGAFNAAFVPLFARMIGEDGEPAAKIFAERVLSLLLSALLIMMVIGEVFMPWLIPILAAGFHGDGPQMALAVAMTRITFPYLLFISLVALLGGVLNSMSRFGAVAFTPVLLNIFMILAAIIGSYFGHVGEILCWGMTLSGLAQFIWLMISAGRAGMSLRLPVPRLGPDMRRFLSLMVPGVIGAGGVQINQLVSTNVASMLPAGSLTYLYYADRLNQLPLGVIGIAIGTAILPTLSRQIRDDDGSGANATQNRGLELALLLTLPAAFALCVIAEPILSVLFQRGHFDAHAVHATALALATYSLGLPAMVAIKVLVPAFYARHDTRTPVRIALACAGVNLVLTLSLAWPLSYLGNALALSTASWCNAISLAVILHRRGHFSVDAQSRRRIPRIIASCAGMTFVVWALEKMLHVLLYQGIEVAKLGALAALVVLGMATYAAFVLILGAADIRELRQILARRRERKAAAR